jgi:TetR/AcrR family transcriptional regulator, cholesterol catabolism regulator
MARPSRRAEVRATAARLFREYGYRVATMDLIAGQVGLNKGTLYYYYPGKSAILYELLSDQLDATLTMLSRVPSGGSAAERLRIFVRQQVGRVAGTPDELVLFFQELPLIDKNLPPEQVASLRRRVEEYRAFSVGLLADGVAAGEFRALDASMIHYSIVGILAYIPIWFRAGAGRTSASLADELAEFVLSGVSPHATEGLSALLSCPRLVVFCATLLIQPDGRLRYF